MAENKVTLSFEILSNQAQAALSSLSSSAKTATSQMSNSFLSISSSFNKMNADISNNFEKISKTTDRFAKKMGTDMKSVALTAGAAFAGLTLYLKNAVNEFTNSQAEMSRTESVLRSTGKEANITEKEVANLANELSRKNAVDAGAIQSGQNLLLQYQNIGSDILPQVTQAMIDYAASQNNGIATEEGMASATALLGKALNNPIRGMALLEKQGVSLSSEQKRLITQFTNTGQSAKAQDILLGALNKGIGGSAEAYKKALPPFKQVELAMKDVSTIVGSVLAPILSTLYNIILKITGFFLAMPEPIQKLVGALVVLSTAIIGVVTAMLSFKALNISGNVKTMIVSIKLLSRSFNSLTSSVITGISSMSAALLTNPFALFIAAVALALTGLVILFRDQFGAAIQYVVKFATDFYNAIKPVIDIVGGVFIQTIKTVFSAFVSTIKNAVSAVMNIFKGLLSVLSFLSPIDDLFKKLGQRIKSTGNLIIFLRNLLIDLAIFWLNSTNMIVEGLNKILVAYNNIAKVVPGLPVIDMGLDKVNAGIDTAIEKLRLLKSQQVGEEKKEDGGEAAKTEEQKAELEKQQAARQADLMKKQEEANQEVGILSGALELKRQVITDDNEQKIIQEAEYLARLDELNLAREEAQRINKELQTQQTQENYVAAEEAYQAHADKMQGIDNAAALAKLETTIQGGEAALAAATSIDKKAAVAHKAFSFATAMINSFVAISKAFSSMPYPANIAAGISMGVIAFANAKKILSYNKGGIVPGVGNTDSVPAILTPGEMILPKDISEKLQSSNVAPVQNPSATVNNINIENNNAFNNQNDMSVFMRKLDAQLARSLK